MKRILYEVKNQYVKTDGLNGIRKKYVKDKDGELYPVVKEYVTNKIRDGQYRFIISGSSYTLNVIWPSSFDIDWGDGTMTSLVNRSEPPEHTYDREGLHCITIKNFVDGYFNFNGDNQLISVLSPLPYIKSKNFDYYYRDCSNLIKVPEDLFINNPQATSFFGSFQACASLREIPETLFSYCPDAEIFTCCFIKNTSLEEIPEKLFSANTRTKRFDHCFEGCDKLSYIPNGLFSNCPEVTNFAACFQQCTGILRYPDGIFDNCLNVTLFLYCFKNCYKMRGTAPPLWERENVSESYACFNNCISLSNYDSIPFLWKSTEDYE